LILASEDFSSQFARNRSFRTIPNQRIKNFYAVTYIYDPDGNLIGVERVTEKSTAELANGKNSIDHYRRVVNWLKVLWNK
jgi:hypothetical protein